MTEQEYADIAAACDRLLRAPSTSLARLAIPALHVLNEHPSSLAHYAPVLSEQPDVRSSNVLKTTIRAARQLLRARGTLRPVSFPSSQTDVLIVSHLLRSDQLHQNSDFYFGALQSHTKDQGATSLLAWVSHLNGVNEPLPPTEFPRMILPRTVSPAAELDIWRQCAHARTTLRREATTSHGPIDRKIALLASEQALSPSTLNNLRMHASLAEVCQALNPKIVITTYEGTVAERLIWHAARTARTRPLCVGYQHARVLQRAHAIRRPVAAPGIECDPDVVLTLGEIPHKALATSPELRSVRFIEYGSHRRAPLPALPPRESRPRRCLVLPDADAGECATLFDFALACAHQKPEIGFTLRPHPMVDVQTLMRRHPALQELPGNVSLSIDKPLVQELAQARYCLYRGSSAAMYAVLAGIKPYYLARTGELPFDCLSELPGWRETVTSPEDLITRMSAAEQSTDSAAASLAASICERYVSPARSAAITELLKMVTR